VFPSVRSCCHFHPAKMEYSRHKEGDPDSRGSKSMMEKHAEAQREAMQTQGLGALRRLVPSASGATCVAALQACAWDPDEAYTHIKAFLDVEEASHKKAAAEAKKAVKKLKKEKSDSDSDSESESDSSSSSSSSSSRKRRRKSKKSKKSKKEKKKRKRHEHDGSDDDDNDRKKSKKSKKSSRKEKKQKDEKDAPLGFGARGFITDTDRSVKEPEFRAWLEEVKLVNIEVLQKFEERDLWKGYVEDYNTATFPDDKYYDLDRWMKVEAIKKARGEGGKNTDEEFVFGDDEANRKFEMENERAARLAFHQKQAYDRMKDSVVDVENLREQERLKEQRKVAYNVGDTQLVERITKKLAPDEKR